MILDCPYGQHSTGSDVGELVEAVQDQLVEVHPGLEYMREEVLTLARQ